MNEFYFSKDPTTESAPKEISITFEGKEYRFLTDRGVFSKKDLDYGSEVLLKEALPFLEGEILDYGAGYGPVGILTMMIKKLPVTFVDINQRAISLVKENLKRHRLKAEALRLDSLETLQKQFDAILLNPPIRTGKDNVYDMYEQAYLHLKDGGSLFVVIQKKQGADSTKKKLLEMFRDVQTIGKSAGYHVFRAVK